MKNLSFILILISGLIFNPIVAAQTLVTQDFTPPIGSIYEYSGTVLNEPGGMTITLSDGASTIPDSIETEVIFSSGDRSVYIYFVDNGVARRVENDPGESRTINFNPHWEQLPPNIDIGGTYESQATTSFMVGDTMISWTASLTSKVIGIETVSVIGESFETLKIESHVEVQATWDGGWQNNVLDEIHWYARGVGEIKTYISNHVTNFGGLDAILVDDVVLVSSNQDLPNLPVHAWAGYPVDEQGWVDTDSWIGWVNVEYEPWLWSTSFDKYIYIEEAGVTEAGGWGFIPE